MQINYANNVINDLKSLGNPEKATAVQRFFKTAEGQYGQGDLFWGITVPEVRKIARTYKDLEITELKKLLAHEVHEVRLCGLLIMVFKFKIEPEPMYNLYLKNTKFINNWDLVDLSVSFIVGAFLQDKDCAILYKLAKSESLWERRISIVATHHFIKQGVYEHTLKISQMLMDDRHDLIHKAAGWMLREVGKRCSVEVLENFMEKYSATMPRTMLRYAIEHMPPDKKQYFMKMKYRKTFDLV